MSLLQAAHDAVARGFHIFPLQPRSKEPLPGSRGFKDSLSGDAALAPWSENPEYNYGVDLGASDLLVLDFDAGESVVPEWLQRTRTFKVKTKSGLHIYFKGARPSKFLYVGGNKVGDIRSTGTYVVGPNCVHPSGAIYSVVDNSDIAPTPDRYREFLRDERPIDVNPNSSERVPRGQHDITAHRMAGKLRAIGLEEEAIYNALVEIAEKRFEDMGSDWKEMLAKHAHNICKHPPGKDESITFSGQPGTTKRTEEVKAELRAANEAFTQLASLPADSEEPEVDDSMLLDYPEFPEWIMSGTSIYEGLVKPTIETSSKFPSFVFMPAVVMMLNAVALKVRVSMNYFVPNVYLGIVAPKATFKSSSIELAQKYFEIAGTVKRGGTNAEGKSLIVVGGSSEGLGLKMYQMNATRTVLYYDELGKFTSKASIDSSSFTDDMLTMYESGLFENALKSKKESFSFQPGTYAVSWMWATTEDRFQKLWSKFGAASSGLDDRMFFLVPPRTPQVVGLYREPNMIEGAALTKARIDAAIAQGTFEYEDYASAQKKIGALTDARSIGLVERFALYFAIDLGLNIIDDECIDRAIALVNYRNAVKERLDPIEADSRQGALQQAITKELRQNRGKMPYRELARTLHAARKGTSYWNDALFGLVKSGLIAIREAQRGGANQRPKMVYLLKQND